MDFARLMKASFSPRLWPTLAKAVLPSVEHKAALKGITPQIVLDVGANRGQFSSFARYLWPDADIFGFEPIPHEAKKYRTVMGDGAKLHECALGSRQTKMQLHLASRADSSSLLPLGEVQKSFFNMDEIGKINVPVVRLDEILSIGNIQAPTLLKIDVQGFELEVLRGAEKLFSEIDWIYVEASFVELYEGQPMFEEISSFVAELGYSFRGQFNVIFTPNGEKIQADCLFAK